MLRFILMFVFLPIAIDALAHQLTHRPNYCTRIKSYTEETVVPKTKRIKVAYKTFCWSITLSCTKHRYELTTVFETVYVNKTKTVYDCCPYYEKKNDSCIPICRLGCGHGECIEPDICLCDAGWRDPYCLAECEPNRFGKGCKGKCTCLNGGECDKKTGRCYCHEGYTGDNCELRCPMHKYGQDCKYDCDCEHDALCDMVDGTCECPEGYEGEYCEKPCKTGTHGKYCEDECVCIPENTETCHHVDGTCHCKPGYIGEFCEQECGNFTYGLNCSEKCNCVNSDFCDTVTGECNCKDGWTGVDCSKKCPFGTYGENCSFLCARCLKVLGICDHVTGNCSCQYGRYGEFCEKDCLPGYWGPNCTRTCNCSDCNPLSGVCSLVASEDTKVEETTAEKTKGEETKAEKTKGEETKDEKTKAEKTEDYQNNNPYIYIPLFFVGVFVMAAILIVCRFAKRKLSSQQTNWKYLTFIKIWRDKAKTEKNITISVASAIANPLYGNPDFVLESEQNETNGIRVSNSNGVKYFKNNLNDLDKEDKMINTENSDVLHEEKKTKTDVIDSDARKSRVFDSLNAKLNGLKRCSKRSSDSAHSSTAELGNDFQPEELEDFNNFENIQGECLYDIPAVVISENMYDDIRKSKG